MRKPRSAVRLFRQLAPMLAVAVLATLAVPASAEDDADLELKPADFVPDEPVAIRVDDLHAGDRGSEVEVTVLNRTKATVTAAVACTLYDDEREELGTATGEVGTVPPGEKRKGTIVGTAEGASRAYCRITDAR